METIRKYELVCETNCEYELDHTLNSSEAVIRMLADTLKVGRHLVEHFYVFMLDTKMNLIGMSDIAKGTLDSAPVHPRELFLFSMTTAKCAGIIVAHNHPSGDPTPSEEDIVTTKRLVEAGNILGIKVVDHIIAGQSGMTFNSASLRKLGYI